MRSLAVEALAVRDFRNLASVDLEFGERFNVFSGSNGQGKTNLLEAIYVLGTSRGFRSARPSDLVTYGRELSSVRAQLQEATDRREQSVGLKAGTRHVQINGKRPKTLAAYAVSTPVVVFHPGIIALSMGGGMDRRRLLDRISLYLEPASLEASDRYARALKERQRALEGRGLHARDLDSWEELVVQYGLAVSSWREKAAERLTSSTIETFERIGAAGSGLRIEYARSAPTTVEDYRNELRRLRATDLRRGAATLGPQRDDLVLSLGGRPVRAIASQGQHRTLVLALKLAEVKIIGEARDVRPLLLLDDVSSELDRERTAALFDFLRDHRGQVFLTTTRPELIDTGSEGGPGVRRDFHVTQGKVDPAGS